MQETSTPGVGGLPAPFLVFFPEGCAEPVLHDFGSLMTLVNPGGAKDPG